MRLRSALLLLAIASAAPLLVQSVLSVGYVYQRENQNIIDAALSRNRATLGAIDAELRGAIGVLRALSTSQSLARGDYRQLQEESQVVLASQPAWQNILVQRPDGQQLANARLAGQETPLPGFIDQGSLQAAVTTQSPFVSNLIAAPHLNNELGVAVRLPVVREGATIYVLTAVMRPIVFQQILANHRLPDGWTSGVVGSDGRLIARVPSVPPGSLASTDYLNATRKAEEGWYRGTTLEGADTYTAFSHSRFTGWTIGYAIPADLILGSSRDSATFLGVGILVSLASALVIGIWLTRRIARPIGALAQAGHQIGTNKDWQPIRSAIEEVEQLGRALAESSASIYERDEQLRMSRTELERQASELREKNANRTRFLALLSHELRNPLAPLRTGLALLKLRPDDARRAATEAMMDRQVTQLTRLIDDLLDIGRIERGQIELKRQPTSLLSVVRHSVEAVTPLVAARRHELRTIVPDREVWVDGDSARLEQVVGNLLTNAAKYTPPGGRIEVQMATSGDLAVLTVSDTGTGFSPQDAERVFEMFTRLPSMEGHDGGGLGIGLSLAQGLVQLHDGKLTAASDGIGKGAVFTLRLPLLRTSALPGDTDEKTVASSGRGRRVLVADDNVDAAETLADFLRLQGFEVLVAHDGIQAIEALRNSRPALAFLDLNMPGADGFQVATLLRCESWSTPIALIALTGMGQTVDLAATREAGFDAHLVKPASANTIAQLAAMTREQVGEWADEQAARGPVR
jgi:signal transduction histidine kinase/CheY-like chemotaxis protein